MTRFESMYKAYAHNYTTDRYNTPKYKLMEGWYDAYLKDNDTEQRIPKIIHLVWVGYTDIPHEYQTYMNTWMNDGWEVMYWNDYNLPDLNDSVYDRMKNNGAKSDYIRYQALYDYGGLYVDTDFEMLKPHDGFLHLNFFTSVADNPTPCLYIGHLGSTPKHKILKSCLDNIYSFNDSSYDNIMRTTGVYYFTDRFFESVNNDYEKIVVFPPEYFYPFPGNQRKIKDRRHRLSFCSDNTHAIHHWGTSWT